MQTKKRLNNTGVDNLNSAMEFWVDFLGLYIILLVAVNVVMDLRGGGG
jgi:hypothetical protein